MGKPLYVCLVGFSKDFDVVNRQILFYKFIISGWTGRVIETLRNLYSKTCFCVKHNGYVSSPVNESVGVNQGGNASGFMFRRYMADLHEFMVYEHAVCAGDLIIPHLLWADDLVLFSESQNGLQRQLNGLQRFCENNLMIVNNLKTKAMFFGKAHEVILTYNGNAVDVVRSYKYLGNVIHSIQKQNGDIFNHSHEYLSDKGRRACFGLKHRLRKFKYLSPTVMFHMYDALISPVLTYGSDIWGHLRTWTSSADGVFFKFMKNTLSVKSSTSHLAVLGECGQLPPSILCKINVLCFYNRLQNLESKCIVKEVFDEL